MGRRIEIGWIAPTAALVVAGALVAPPSSRAYTLAGWSLGLDQREVGVFDNFGDPSANDNVTQHPNWPGYCGVELACWKAVTEWQSELFGDGSGDPLQTDGVGSGGANFDPVWCGAVTTPGGSGGNVISELQGSGGGVIAFTEFGSGGWRIRLYSEWTWDDGPGAPIPGALDVQAVITHEYGHALGLGHSTVAGATMAATISGDGTAARSIEADDRAGVQAIYGAKSLLKPRITSLELVGGVLVLKGSGFVGLNDVWVTPAELKPLPTPTVFLDVNPEPDGSLHLPGGADVGAVAVVTGSANHELSNSFPYPGTAPSPYYYCAGKPNSIGCLSTPFVVGTLSASAPAGGVVVCPSLLNNKFGLTFYGTSGPHALPFGGGTLCVHPPIRRLPVHSTGGSPPPTLDCSGFLQDDLNAWIAGGNDPALTAGSWVWFQGWSRDPGFAPPNNVGLTWGMRVAIGP